jgi:addiction module HigA family antidote
MTDKRLAPIHPGEILEEEFMRPLGLSANALAKAVDVPVTRVSEIVRGRRGVTADTALRFGRFFGTSPELWLGLQSEYDLRLARLESGASIESRVVPLKAAARRYESPRDSRARSEVREATNAYVSRGQTRTRDRRRVRRTSG